MLPGLAVATSTFYPRSRSHLVVDGFFLLFIPFAFWFMAPFAFSCRLLDSFLKAALRIQLAATSLSLPVGFVVTAVLAPYFDNLSLCPSRGRLSIRVQRKISRVPSFIMGLDRSV